MLMIGVTNLLADENPKSGDVTLNIKLHKIQSLVVNTGQTTVNLEYKEIDDYAEGVQSKKDNHLIIYSTGGFEIKAASQAAVLTGPDNNLNIDIADILLTASKGNNNDLNTYTFPTDAALTQSGTSLIKSSKGGNNVNFNVNYKAAGNDKYLNHYVKGEDPTVYTTTVTYTIAPN